MAGDPWTPDPKAAEIIENAIEEWIDCQLADLENSRTAGERALRDLRAAGFAVLPREATEGMQLAGHDVRSDPVTGLPTSRSVDEIWSAMVTAAERPDGR